MASAAGRSKNKKKQQKRIAAHPDAGQPASPRRLISLLGLLLVGATLALYFPVHHHPFVNYDDDEYVTDNVHVKGGLTGGTIAWAFTTFDAANWHPLTWLAHALDYQLFQLDPAGHHDTNLLLHALNVVLLFGFCGRQLATPAAV